MTEQFRQGGLETHILDSCRYLLAHGHDVHVITGTGESTELERVIGRPVRQVDIGFDLSMARALQSIEAVAEYCTNHSVQVLHAHPFSSLLLGALTAAKLDIPFVATLHGPGSLGGPYHVSYRLLLLTVVLPDAYKVFCVSSEVLAAAYASQPQADYQLLPNGVDLERFRSVRRDRDGPWALVGRLDSDKAEGMTSFLSLYMQARPTGRVDVYGDGNARAELAGWAEAAGFGSSIAFRGHKDDLPSELAEGYAGVAGMGRVVLEGGALGLPVMLVGYDGVKGLVRPGQADALAASNFSGRGVRTRTFHDFASDLAAADSCAETFDLRQWVARNRDMAIIGREYLESLRGLGGGTALRSKFVLDSLEPSGGILFGPEGLEHLMGALVEGCAFSSEKLRILESRLRWRRYRIADQAASLVHGLRVFADRLGLSDRR